MSFHILIIEYFMYIWKKKKGHKKRKRKRKQISGKSQTSKNYCLVLSPPPEIKILSVLDCGFFAG